MYIMNVYITYIKEIMMGLFSKVDKDNIDKCLSFLENMNKELNEMMSQMMDQKYGFEPDTVSLPLILIFSEAATTNSNYPARKKLMNTLAVKTARNESNMVRSTYNQVRTMFKNSVVSGIMGSGEFFYDDFDELDTSGSMCRLSFSATGLMYDSLLTVDDFNDEELEKIKEKYTDFFYNLTDYVVDKYNEFIELLEEYFAI